jgi:hypothetical protein
MGLKLGNAENWNEIFYQSFNAQQSGQFYAPIPKITVPAQLESNILAVYVTCVPAKPTWYFAGFLNQSVYTGLTVGDTPNAESAQRRKIWLNKITLIRLDRLADSYAVTFDVPKWFQSVTFHLWEYIGPNADSADIESQLEAVNAKLETIENKVDQLWI